MLILGISAYYHDSAASLIEDGKVIAAAQEERFSRRKHDPSFPREAITYCMEHRGISFSDLDAVVFYDKPLLKFERLLETYYAFAPKGLISFAKAIPIWIKEKLFLKKVIREELNRIASFDSKNIPLLFPEHHLSHAASAFFPSGFESAAILTLDGVGEWATASILKASGNKVEVLKELAFPHSLGLLYSAFTYFLGFRVNSGEYKLMGLAPYGNPDSKQVQEFKETIRDKLVKIHPDGSIRLNQSYFKYAYGLRMVEDKQWEKLFGFPYRNESDALEQHHCNLGLAIQQITEEIVLLMAKEAKKLTGMENLCMAGGVALNCVANGVLQKAGIFKRLFIQPAAGDAGASLGAALAAYHIHFEKELIKLADHEKDAMQGSYLGPAYSDLEIERIARKFNSAYSKYSEEELCEKIAGLITEGKVIGWFQGRMEFGPRALGNRSILGDPRNPEMQKRINLKIKYRESFRPFAPSVLAEDAADYFELETPSPYMLLVRHVLKSRRKTLPENYQELGIRDKLYHQRSDIPAITHVDQSVRIQTVHPETNSRYYKLIQAFKRITGYGMLINTSFNVRGEPIVCSPEDAFNCFLRTEMDYLVIGTYVFAKNEQISNPHAEKARSQLFELD